MRQTSLLEDDRAEHDDDGEPAPGDDGLHDQTLLEEIFNEVPHVATHQYLTMLSV